MTGVVKKAGGFLVIVLGLAVASPLGFAGDSGSQKSAAPAWLVQVAPQALEHRQREVLHQLRMLPYYTIFDNIEFRLEGDQVELSGQVVWPTLKSDAENVVKHVEGVKGVINRIEVLPVSNFDDRIRLAEYRAIYGDPALSDRYGHQPIPSIHIIVKNGQVTLVGVVANMMDKNIAGIRANGVGGVFSVKNDLRLG